MDLNKFEVENLTWRLRNMWSKNAQEGFSEIGSLHGAFAKTCLPVGPGGQKGPWGSTVAAVPGQASQWQFSSHLEPWLFDAFCNS